MFKQQQKDCVSRQRVEKREQGVQPNRMAGFGIKVVSNWVDDRKGNNVSQGKKEHGKSPIMKTDPYPSQQPSKAGSIRGINVVSSRQSSNERPYITSRSNSKQKESKQIKSQTNISEFDSVVVSKDPSFQKQSTSKQDDHEKLLEAAEMRFKQAIYKQNAMYQLQIDELKEIIGSNDERIDNLISTLNFLVENGGRKDKGLGKLEARVNSNQRYAEQCYEYTLARCSDSETVLRHLSQQIHQNIVTNIETQNKMQYIQRIVVDIFTVQRSLFYQQQANFHKEINKIQEILTNLQEKLIYLEQIQLKHSLDQMRSQNWKEHLLQLRQKIDSISNSSQENKPNATIGYGWISKQELAIKMEALEFKISQIETQKGSIQQQYRIKQEKSQQAIWQLSALLNKQERQLEKIQRQHNSLVSYNKQIQNKLIQSKHRENSMEAYVHSKFKILETSTNCEQTLRIQKENQVFREKYEQLFRHNQYLEDINCRNNLQLLNNAKIIEELQNKLEEKEKPSNAFSQLHYVNLAQREQIQNLKKKVGDLSRKIQDKDQQIYNKSIQIQRLSVSIETTKEQLNKSIRKAQENNLLLQQATTQRQALAAEHQKLYNQLIATQKELQEEELYSEHLQKENQKLETRLGQYSRNFEEQSLMFKTTIDRLKKEREEIKYTESKTDRPSSAFKSTPPQPKAVFSNSSLAKAQQEKLLRLKKAIDVAGYKKPVPCQIDGTGYLKHLDHGTYIVDAQENLFDLSNEQKHLAIRTNLIQLFQ